MSRPYLQSELLEAHQDTFVELLDLLQRIPEKGSAEEERLEEIVSQLEQLPEKKHEQTEDLCSTIKRLRHWIECSEAELATSSKDALMQAVEEVRLRTIAVSMFAPDQQDADQSSSVLNLANGVVSNLTLEHLRGDIISTTIGQHVVILLPPLVNEDTADEVLAGLLQIFDKTRSHYNWIIDFSAVKQLSVFAFGGMIGYAQSLQNQDGKLFVCWLSDNLITPTMRNTLGRHSKLKKIGKYWFSTGCKEGCCEHRTPCPSHCKLDR